MCRFATFRTGSSYLKDDFPSVTLRSRVLISRGYGNGKRVWNAAENTVCFIIQLRPDWGAFCLNFETFDYNEMQSEIGTTLTQLHSCRAKRAQYMWSSGAFGKVESALGMAASSNEFHHFNQAFARSSRVLSLEIEHFRTPTRGLQFGSSWALTSVQKFLSRLNFAWRRNDVAQYLPGAID
jgi:hypothetical protein